LERLYDPGMGERNHDRQQREARLRYIGALNRARAASSTLAEIAPPLDPDVDWDPDQWQALLDAVTTFQALVDARRDWDGLCREQHGAH